MKFAYDGVESTTRYRQPKGGCTYRPSGTSRKMGSTMKAATKSSSERPSRKPRAPCQESPYYRHPLGPPSEEPRTPENGLGAHYGNQMSAVPAGSYDVINMASHWQYPDVYNVQPAGVKTRSEDGGYYQPLIAEPDAFSDGAVGSYPYPGVSEPTPWMGGEQQECRY